MLNRVGNGAAVAALPLAAAIAAQSAGHMLLTWVFGGLSVVVMLVACAPWVPVARDALPTVRRSQAIERLILEGYALNARRVSSDDELRVWLSDWQRWQQAIADRLPAFHAQTILMAPVVAYAVSGSFNGEHADARNVLHHHIGALKQLLESAPEWSKSQ